jgi:acetylornithine/N-succinyldiaminopimelate aminotransferase
MTATPVTPVTTVPTGPSVPPPPATSATSAPWVDLARHRMMRNYPDTDVVFVRGSGTVLIDADGHEWLDLLSGISVTNLGHTHPAVTDAVMRQVGTLVHTSNLFLSPPALELAERLAALAGWPDARVFFAQCGATANEAAIKLARRHGKLQHPDKVRLVALEGSFHGRTLATLEATGQPSKHEPYRPLAGFVDLVAHDDPGALMAAVGPDTCAVMLEVVQGEGGVRPLAPEVLAAAREACDRHGALLIVDEVQTGVGRTGSWFGFQQTDVVPDVVTLAKALANGLPIGACIARGPAAEVFRPGDHATTFGGNPVTASAALAVLEAIEVEELLDATRVRAAQFRLGLADLAARTGTVLEVRGVGLLLGVVLAGPFAAQVVAECRAHRLIINAVAPDVLRLAPPLTISAAEVADALQRLTDAITAASAAVAAMDEGIEP